MNVTNPFLQKIKSFLNHRKYRLVSDYHIWISQNEPTKTQLANQSVEASSLDYQPLISIILPVWNTPSEILDQTITSVIDQTYRNWELCIADGCSNLETQQTLSNWANMDDRIHVEFLEENEGIALNSNAAVALAQGDFIGFLDHDDLLAPCALFEVVHRLQANDNVDVLYSDEDKIDENGGRFDPFFKPEFSPDYLRSVNYMPHFLVVRKSLGDEVGWLQKGYDGAQDYDLILRLVEKARSIVHIPVVLYHWRVWAASTASGSEAKPYANNAGKKALQEHLDRVGLLAEVQNGHSSTFYRIRYHIQGSPRVSIIIPNQDHASDLKVCMDSIFQKTSYTNYEILLVENGSKEPETFSLYETLAQDPRCQDHPLAGTLQLFACK